MMKLNPEYIKKIIKAGFNPLLRDKKGNSASMAANKKCSRHFKYPYSSKILENCVESISLLSGKDVHEIIPTVCSKKFILSASKRRRYIKKKDGYYQYRMGKLVKANIDPCGKYREYGKKK